MKMGKWKKRKKNTAERE